jgi:putative nucleotidyltransferase with HDIG domain
MEIEKIINEIECLQPVSKANSRIMDIIADPNSSLKEVVDIVKYDQGMTANLLKICNSAYFSLNREIVSLKQAIAYLGIEKVASLVMINNNAENFKKTHKGYDLQEGELWRYSVASALIAQDLAEKRKLKNSSMLFTAALLKDIGKVILHTYIHDVFEDITNLVQEQAITFIEAEKQILGIDHAELGARVAEKWKFSPRIVYLIRNHHNPDNAEPDDVYLPIIYLADSVCMMIGVGVGADGLLYRYHQDVVDKLNFSDIDLQNTIADFWEKLKSIENMIQLSGGN